MDGVNQVLICPLQVASTKYNYLTFFDTSCCHARVAEKKLRELSHENPARSQLAKSALPSNADGPSKKRPYARTENKGVLDRTYLYGNFPRACPVLPRTTTKSL